MVWVPSLTLSPWVPFEPGRPINPLRETQKRKLKKPKPPTAKPNELCTHGDTTSVPQSCHWCPRGIFSPAGTMLVRSWGCTSPPEATAAHPAASQMSDPKMHHPHRAAGSPCYPGPHQPSETAAQHPNCWGEAHLTARRGRSVLAELGHRCWKVGECSGEQQPGSSLELWPLGMSMNTHEPTCGGT